RNVRARALDQRRVPLLSALEGLALDQVCPIAQRDVGAVQVDRLVGPLPGQPELSPGADVLLRPSRRRAGPLRADPRAGALGAEDAVDLIEGEARERIALVDHEHQPGSRAFRIVVRAVGELDLQWGVAERALERLQRRMPGA